MQQKQRQFAEIRIFNLNLVHHAHTSSNTRRDRMAQVVASQYGYFPAVGEENDGSAASSSALVDPFFCQRGR